MELVSAVLLTILVIENLLIASYMVLLADRVASMYGRVSKMAETSVVLRRQLDKVRN